MKWASFIAQSLYDDAYISSMNTEFDYTVTDNDGNEIVCRVYEDGAVDDIDNRSGFILCSEVLTALG